MTPVTKIFQPRAQTLATDLRAAIWLNPSQQLSTTELLAHPPLVGWQGERNLWVSPQLRCRPMWRKQDPLQILRVGWPINLQLVPPCLSSSLSPACWHMTSMHFVQTCATWTVCTKSHPGLWIPGHHPGCYISPLLRLIPSNNEYLPSVMIHLLREFARSSLKAYRPQKN